MARARDLEAAYLRSPDPIARSGFSGGPERWFAERSPLVEAIDGDGDFLDVGCANGLLARDVVGWARARGHDLIPHGVDIGPGLVDLAKHDLPALAGNFTVADAWQWEPDRRWRFVYSMLDLSPPGQRCEWLNRLSRWVEPGGRLIIGAYGSRSRPLPPMDVAGVMGGCGMTVIGSSHGGEPPVTRFAWTEPAAP